MFQIHVVIKYKLLLLTKLNPKMKKITLSLLFGFMSVIAFSQIGLIENFDDGFTLPTGWTSNPEDYGVSFVQNCAGRSIRTYLDNTNLDAQFTSPNIEGQSNGTDLSISFDYKIVNWSEATVATPTGWGELLVEFSTNNGVTWTNAETINDANHVSSAECVNWTTTIPADDLPIGSDFKLRINANWTAGFYYIYLDNISATQTNNDLPYCVNLITPTNGSAGVSINTDLEWSTATGITTGYTLSVGTNPGGTEIVNNVDVGNVTSYDLPTLLYETVYYVNIIPYNDNGNAENCLEHTFTTENNPNQILDCAAGDIVNTVFCYENNDITEFSFTSIDGTALVVIFNSGQTENNFDKLIVLDSDGTELYSGYGNSGDLTGLVFTSTGNSITVGVSSDGTSINCTNNPWDFDVSCLDTSALPNCNASLITPINGETAIDIDADLQWSPASILVTGYIISVGTTLGGTDIANNEDVGSATTFDPGTLLYETTYYVTIVPYNDNGSAINCNEESFTTKNDPNQIIDCAIGEIINQTYCYTNNDTMQFNYSSNDGSQVAVVFNSGMTENNNDLLLITDTDGTILYSGFGDNGDLTGLVFTSSGDSITVGVASGGSFTSCTNDPWDFDVTCFDTSAIPNCNASLLMPTNGTLDADINTDLVWSPASILVTGYIISMGTTPGATDVLESVDVGNILTYEPGTLAYETTYYVTIVPYNDNGSATGCTEQIFTTVNDPIQILDCASGDVINTVFCYEDDDTTEFNFTTNDGSPLFVVFNSGITENRFDELVITDSDGTIIYNDYGENGDLAGLTFTSSGGSITVGVTSDASLVRCTNDPWDFDVYCVSNIGLIEVNAFVDENSDTVFDASEINFTNGVFAYEVNNNGVIKYVNSSSGSFTIPDTGDNYDISFTMFDEYSNCLAQTFILVEDVNAISGETTEVNFPITIISDCDDVAVYLSSNVAPRPGVLYSNVLIIKNLGSLPVSGSVEFTNDGSVTLDNVYNVDSGNTVTNTATGFILNFNNLLAGNTEQVNVQLNIPINLNIGDLVTNSVIYNVSDINLDNNQSILTQEIVNSYDPNNKLEAHGPVIKLDEFTNEDYLYYTINFQNLGTAEALDIRVEDVLDAQ
jgi:hypothetical protein